MQQACVSCTGRIIAYRDCIFVLSLTARPSSGLVSEADSPPFLSLTCLSRLESAINIFLEGVSP